MTTSQDHTPLESLLLYRGILKLGLNINAFAEVSKILKSNSLVRNEPTYDPSRLDPDVLQELFLQILWEELKAGSDTAARSDGDPSPASKKRKLQHPPDPNLHEARRHAEKVPALVSKLHASYIASAIRDIQTFEAQFDKAKDELDALENGGDNQATAQEGGPVNNLNRAQDAGGQHGVRLMNGTGSTAQPLPQQPVSQQALEQVSEQDGRRNGSATPDRISLAQPTPAPPAPLAPAVEHAVPRSPQPSHGPASEAAVRPHEPRKPSPPNGAHQVLQPPRTVPSFSPHPGQSPSSGSAEVLQRPESAPRSGQSPVPQQGSPQMQAPGQGQLKWEPPYQPSPAALPQPPSSVSPSPQPIQRPLQTSHPQQAQQPRWNAPPPIQQQQQQQQPQQQYPPQQSLPQQHFSHQGIQNVQSVLVPPSNSSQYIPPAQQQVPSPASTVSAATHSSIQDRPPSAAPSVVPRASTPGQVQEQVRPQPAYSNYSQATGQRPLVAASPIPSRVPVSAGPSLSPSLAAPQLPPQNGAHMPTLQAPPPYPHQGVQSVPPSPSISQADNRKARASPHPAVPDRIQQVQRLAGATPGPSSSKIGPVTPAPQTPVPLFLSRPLGGSGTRWKTSRTPSTPQEPKRGPTEVPASPAYDPGSPVLRPSAPASATSQTSKGMLESMHAEETSASKPKRRGRAPHNAQHGDAAQSPHRPVSEQQVSQPAPSPMDDVSYAAGDADFPRVKDEVMTPRPQMEAPPAEAGDVTADESVTSIRRVASRRPKKRLRPDSSPTPARTPIQTPTENRLPPPIMPSMRPTEVLWTRAFNKVSGSAMEQIIHHRDASLFANPIREKDARGYHDVILLPQDLKSIRAAITHGNKAASQAAAALPCGDPGTSSVLLPLSEELVPPRGIINSAQLDRELAHMFANAVMFNPDTNHGPGPAFLRDGDAHEAAVAAAGDGVNVPQLGYKVDEFGVVKNARAMFVEVEKLVSELRSAEIQRGARLPLPLPSSLLAGGVGGASAPGTGSSTRDASVANGEPSAAAAGAAAATSAAAVAARENDGAASNVGDDTVDEQTATEAEMGPGHVAKRRRVGRKGAGE